MVEITQFLWLEFQARGRFMKYFMSVEDVFIVDHF